MIVYESFGTISLAKFVNCDMLYRVCSVIVKPLWAYPINVNEDTLFPITLLIVDYIFYVLWPILEFNGLW